MFIHTAATILLCLNGILACTYMGTEYKIGDKFKASDGCNDCVCGAIGTVCTKMFCKPDTVVTSCKVTEKDGTTSIYQNGQAFKAADGCNTCACANGVPMCTLMACDIKDVACKDPATGKLLAKGDTFKAADGCNDCVCSESGIQCTDNVCATDTAKSPAAGTCVSKDSGMTYNDGDKFKAADGCNYCYCKGGLISCTEMACLQKNQCFDKFTNQLYNEGESFEAPDGCNTCKCGNGQIACTQTAC